MEPITTDPITPVPQVLSMGTIIGLILRHGLSFYSGIAAFVGSGNSTVEGAFESFIAGLVSGNYWQVSSALAALLALGLSMYDKKKSKQNKAKDNQENKNEVMVPKPPRRPIFKKSRPIFR